MENHTAELLFDNLYSSASLLQFVLCHLLLTEILPLQRFLGVSFEEQKYGKRIPFHHLLTIVMFHLQKEYVPRLKFLIYPNHVHLHSYKQLHQQNLEFHLQILILINLFCLLSTARATMEYPAPTVNCVPSNFIYLRLFPSLITTPSIPLSDTSRFDPLPIALQFTRYFCTSCIVFFNPSIDVGS